MLSGEHVSVNEIFTSSRLIDSTGDQIALCFFSPDATVCQSEKHEGAGREKKRTKRGRFGPDVYVAQSRTTSDIFLHAATNSAGLMSNVCTTDSLSAGEDFF